jgi:hypothetical protein
MRSLREFNLVNCPSAPVKQKKRLNEVKIAPGRHDVLDKAGGV